MHARSLKVPACLHESINLPAWACSNLILSFLGSNEPEAERVKRNLSYANFRKCCVWAENKDLFEGKLVWLVSHTDDGIVLWPLFSVANMPFWMINEIIWIVFYVVLMLEDVTFPVCLLWCLSSKTLSASHQLNFSVFNSTFNLFLLLQETGLFLFRPKVQIIFIQTRKRWITWSWIFFLLFFIWWARGFTVFPQLISFSVVMSDLYRCFGLLLYFNFLYGCCLKKKQLFVFY